MADSETIIQDVEQVKKGVQSLTGQYHDLLRQVQMLQGYGGTLEPTAGISGWSETSPYVEADAVTEHFTTIPTTTYVGIGQSLLAGSNITFERIDNTPYLRISAASGLCYDYIVKADGTGTHTSLFGASGALLAAIAAGGKKSIWLCDDETITAATALTTMASDSEVTITAPLFQRRTLTVSTGGSVPVFTFTTDTDGKLIFENIKWSVSTTRDLFLGSTTASLILDFRRCEFGGSAGVRYIMNHSSNGASVGDITLQDCTGQLDSVYTHSGLSGGQLNVNIIDSTITWDDWPFKVGDVTANWNGDIFISGGTHSPPNANWQQYGSGVRVIIENTTIQWSGLSASRILFASAGSNPTNNGEFIARNVVFNTTRSDAQFLVHSSSVATAHHVIVQNIFADEGLGTASGVVPLMSFTTTGTGTLIIDLNAVTMHGGWTDIYTTTGSNITIAAGTQHSTLFGLTVDDHTIYALLAGRSGGQVLYGGTAASNALTLKSTSHGTKGQIIFDELTGAVVNGYLRVGATAAPGNVTAGDITGIRFILGDATTALGAAGDNALVSRVSGTLTATSGATVFSGMYPTLAPASNSAAEFRTLNFLSIIPPTTDVDFSAPITAGYFEGVRPRGSGNLTRATAPGGAVGVQAIGVVFDSSADDAGTITLAAGIVAFPYKRPSGAFTTKALTTGIALWMPNPDSAGGLTLGTLVGIELEKYTRATTNIEFRNAGKMVFTPTSQTLAAAGNTIGSTAHTYWLDNSTGASLTLTSTPTITAGVADGQLLLLVNVDTADNIVIQDETALAGSDLRLPGAASLTLGPRDSVLLEWHSAVSEWWAVASANL